MVKHIVMWKMRGGGDAGSAQADAEELKRRAEALAGRIPGLLHIEVGIDFSRTAASADIVLYSEFTDREALVAYQAHPEHVAVGEFVGSVCEGRIVADYAV